MNIITVLGIFFSTFVLSLGLIVYISNNKNKINRYFLSLTAFVALWIIFYVISIYESESLVYLKLTDVTGIFGSVILLSFALIYPEDYFSKNKKYVLVLSMLSAIIFAPIVFFTNLVVPGVEFVDSVAVPNFGTLAWPFFMLIYIYLISSVVLLLYKYLKLYKNNKFQKDKLKFVFYGIGITALFISLMSFSGLLFDKKVSRFMDTSIPFASIAFVVFTSIGILKGGLFDVRMAVVRSVTYAQVVATLAGLYVVLTFALSSLFGFVGSSPIELAINIVITLSLVFLFQPLRRFFDKITNKIFYKDNYDTDEFFGRVNKILAITTDLKDLLKDASIEINKTLKGSQSSLYVLTDNGKIVSGETDDKSTIDDTDLINLFSYASNQGKIIIRGLMSENAPIKKLLSSNKIEIVLPLMKGHKLIGLFLMGENMSSNYTNRDVSVLETISNGLIVAILNALAVQEIRDFNVTLRKKIDEATKELRIKNAMLKKLDKAKDEFVSMASHQLRTPLTSVKGYLSMVIEGDAGKVTQSQKDLLGEAFSSNEKMVSLVNDFLNVSRIQTGKFVLDKVPIDLSKLIAEEINDLQQNAKKRNLNMVYKPPKNFPILNIDVGKIRQVIMNFTDNALYYSNPDTDVNISLTVDGGDAVFKVIDTGIGVPVGERDQLFTKFYRASNARKQRPDGTGVGLYLAKRIVTDHGGKIVFETSEGKGSTFGFRLPIKELSV